MSDLISICIPTYNRPDLLEVALDSCFAQTYPAYDIIIGDDSRNDDSTKLVERYAARHPGVIHYQRNQPSLGQAANVNDLFSRANGERLVLLHDDDVLLPDTLARLAACWETLPTLIAAFGKQELIDHAGHDLPGSDAMNATYNRVAANSGRQAVPAIAGLLRMFPNDGYLVRTDVARRIGYRPPSEVGQSCDTDFGLRLCLTGGDIWFLDEYTAKYRISADALTASNVLEPYSYEMIKEADVPAAARAAQSQALRTLAPAAASGFARLGQPKKALGIFLSPDYPLRDRLRIRGLYHLARIALAFVRGALPRASR